VFADPDSQSREIVGAERLGDRSQAVVARETPPNLSCSRPVQVQLVVRDDETRQVLE